LAEKGIDQLLVGDLVRPGDSAPDAISNLRWLTGFSGTSGLAIVGAEDRVFLTDFRYVERAQRELAAEFERATAERELLDGAVQWLRGRVGYDDAQTSVKSLRKLEELVPEGVELVAAGGLVETLRRRKDAGELRAIADAARLADEVYGWTFDRGVVGRTERAIIRARGGPRGGVADRHGRDRRRLLLRLHAHGGGRRDRRRGARGL
jgi:Xaa-Pro aminopeptidase